MSESGDKSARSLAELGEVLRKAREEKELPLRAYADELKIRLKYLEAIEKAVPSDLPGQVFYIAFAKSYATMLGLDGEAISQQVRAALLREDSGSNRQKIARLGLVLSDPRNLMRTPTPPSKPRKSFSSESAFGALDKRPLSLPSTDKHGVWEKFFSPFYIAGGMIALVLFYLGGVILLDLIKEKGVNVRSLTTRLAPEQVAEEEPSRVVESESAAPSQQQKVYGAQGGARVVLQAREPCWIAVFSTESSLSTLEQTRLLFAGNLNVGDRYRVPVQLGIILKSGNLDALDFLVQDKLVDPFRIDSPSGFMSLEPAHLRNQTAVRDGNALARERLPVVREIELLRELRGQEALRKDDL